MYELDDAIEKAIGKAWKSRVPHEKKEWMRQARHDIISFHGGQLWGSSGYDLKLSEQEAKAISDAGISISDHPFAPAR